MTPARDRSRPTPAGEPRPTPVEDVPDVATPPPAPSPEPAPEPAEEQSSAGLRAVEEQSTPETIVGVVEQTAYPVFGRGRALPPIPDSAYGPDSTPLDDMRDDHPLSAAEALAEVMRRVEPIRKGRTADARAGGYAFRGIDDVYASLHALFAEVGLVVLPRTLSREREQRARASGEGYNYVTHVHVQLVFLAQDGSTEALDVWGEGADTGDKSTGKAYSQGIKSALLAAFLIPTEASAQDDPDATNSEPSRSFSAEEQARARTALDAARQQTTLDSLVATGRRAVQLLDVPLVGPDGSVAPLRYHLDQLRIALENHVPEATS